MQSLNIYSDLNSEIFLAGKASHLIRKGVRLVNSIFDRDWNVVLYIILILPIFIVFTLSLFPVLLFLYWFIFLLNKQFPRTSRNDLKKEINNLASYKEARSRISGFTKILHDFKDLETMMDHKLIIFKPVLAPEISITISLVSEYLVKKEAILAQYDEPVLCDFEAYIVKESDLWKNRTQAYDYLL